MYDRQSSDLLKSAPSIYDIDPEDLPRILTESYATLVSERLSKTNPDKDEDATVAFLLTIAEAYETIAGLVDDDSLRRASAFVAGSAYQILSRSDKYNSSRESQLFGRDHVSASIVATVLFLIAEQYPDAREAAEYINLNNNDQGNLYQMLGESIRNLGRGEFQDIAARSGRRSKLNLVEKDIYNKATFSLYEAILEGVELLATTVLDTSPPATFSRRFDAPQVAFSRVVEISTYNHKEIGPFSSGPTFLTTYPGPQHLASLLLKAAGTLTDASIFRIDPPSGIDLQGWNKWLRFRSKSKPVLWPNYREALKKGFHEIGNSCVMVLPTGAGKTTLAEVKMAAVLAQGKQVVFLAPTNALVEQLQYDLKEAFPEDLIGNSVSSDFDLIHTVEKELQPIEVMTPEKCLALLNFMPTAFINTGLLVFDECHMISPEAGSLRRALDGMLCVLSFQAIVPQADFLFLSAMINNGEEFSAWIEGLTEKKCISINLFWKPSRQARGVVVYSKEELAVALRKAAAIQNQLKTKGLSKPAKEELKGRPFGLFGLVHNWHPEKKEDIKLVKLSADLIQLEGKIWGKNRIYLKSNVNIVAVELAISAANSGLKTIIFVNNAAWTVSTAKKVNDRLDHDLFFTNKENQLKDAIFTEFGGLEHSLLDGFSSALPHCANLIPLERRLAESLFKRPDGPRVIVATTTLSQGMNLPAQMAILAGDIRTGSNNKPEELKAHELLNAAGRAGRAGHLANGVVVLIPSKVVLFKGVNKDLEANALKALGSILPDYECCLKLTDPLQNVLDQVQAGDEVTPEVLYSFYRLLSESTEDGKELNADKTFFRSLAAFQARTQEEKEEFQTKVKAFKRKLLEFKNEETPSWLVKLTTQSGTSPEILDKLYQHIRNNIDNLPVTIQGWAFWIIEWLKENRDAAEFCFGYDLSKAYKAVGKKKRDIFAENDFDLLFLGLQAWTSGEPINVINEALGADNSKDIKCTRARILVTDIAPRSFAFFINIVTQITTILFSENEVLPSNPAVLECVSTAVRKGYDTPEKLAFADLNKGNFLSRVEAHQNFNLNYPGGLGLPESMDYNSIYSFLAKIL